MQKNTIKSLSLFFYNMKYDTHTNKANNFFIGLYVNKYIVTDIELPNFRVRIVGRTSVGVDKQAWFIFFYSNNKYTYINMTLTTPSFAKNKHTLKSAVEEKILVIATIFIRTQTTSHN